MASPPGGTAIDMGTLARAAGKLAARTNAQNAAPKRLMAPGTATKAPSPSFGLSPVTGQPVTPKGESDPYENSFFGPGHPLPPSAQEETHGRAFDFPTNFNTSIRPRAYEPIDFPTLRALADNYDLVRLAVETRKDQMAKLRWTITRKDDGSQDAKAEEIEAFLQEPDGEHDWTDWSRMLIEEVLVPDAPAVYIQPTLGGQPFAIEVIDGTTIKRVLDERGRTPAPPKPGEAFDPAIHTAYQQIIKGLPATDYHRDELLYKPRNPRVNKVYGYSPVEQIVMLVNIGLRRETHQLAFYTAGNIPEMLMGTPANWNPDQIAKYQKLWDQMLAGDIEARRQLRFVPGDVKPLPLRPESSLFDMFDEWLARVVCYCFSLPPTAFVKQQNRATAESAQEAALEEGLSPLMEWKVRFMNTLIRKAWKTSDYEFGWLDDLAVDPLEQAQIDHIYVSDGVRLPNEIRDDHSWEPLPEDKNVTPQKPSPFGAQPPKPAGDEPGQPSATPPKPGGTDSVMTAVSEKLAKRRSQRLRKRKARRPY